MKKYIFAAIIFLVFNFSLALTLIVEKNGDVVINGQAYQDFTNKQGKIWAIKYYNSSFEGNLSIVLPKDSIIKSIKTGNNYSIIYENSFNIIFENQKNISIAVYYEMDTLNKINLTYFYFGSAFVFLVFIFFVFKFFLLKKRQKRNKAECLGKNCEYTKSFFIKNNN